MYLGEIAERNLAGLRKLVRTPTVSSARVEVTPITHATSEFNSETKFAPAGTLQ